jgi:diguanylate cyclase (GGDEF)-like protein
MKVRTSKSHHADERYAAQRRLGFPWLRFLPDLEEEYRESYIGLNASRMRASSFIGVFGVIGFLFLDQFGANLLPASGDWILMLVTLPSAIGPVLMTFRRNSSRYLLHLIFAATLAAALSILWVINIGRAANEWFPYEALFLVVIYIYFVSGLTFYQAIVAGVILTLAFVITNWTLREHYKLVYETFYLFLANGIGVIGHYLLERQSRTMFLLYHELEQQAVLDSLTGLMNRRAFTARLEAIWRQARREQRPVGLMLVDLDDFKRVNDSCGHPFGDSALSHVGAVLRASALRPLDAAARYGGDEFIAVWFDMDAGRLEKLAVELPARIGTLRCGAGDAGLKVSVSGGAVLAWPAPGLGAQDAIKAADEMLYDRKRNSRGTIGYKVLNSARPL